MKYLFGINIIRKKMCLVYLKNSKNNEYIKHLNLFNLILQNLVLRKLKKKSFK